MWNFVLGAVAGSITAGVLLIAAARQPDIQARLGLIPPPPIAVAVAKPVEIRCPPPKPSAKAEGAAQEILFNRQRFWSVAP